MPIPPNPHFVPQYLHVGIELAYFLLITGLCLVTYLRTREIEQLTGHKGIMLFRKIFLFFSLAYLVRFIHMLFIFILGQNGLRAAPLLQRTLLFPVALLSTIALLYLLATILATHIKKLNLPEGKLFWIFTAAATVLVIPTMVFRSQTILIVIQLVLILCAGTHLLFCKHKVSSKKNQGFFNSKLLFILISLFWVLNLILTARSLTTLELRTSVYLASIIIFALIYYRVNKRLSSK